MRARVKLRVARSASEQSQGTAQVGLGGSDEVASAAFLRWAGASVFSFGFTRSTSRQPVPPHKGHCDSAMTRKHRLSAPGRAREHLRGKNRKCEKRSARPNWRDRLFVNAD